MRALIAGGGIAGSVAAIALRRAGLDVSVFEARHPARIWAPGSCLTVAVNGLAALRAVGLDEPVLSAGYPAGMRSLARAAGPPLAQSPIGPVLGNGLSTLVIGRGELLRILHRAAVSRGVSLHYGRSLVRAQPGQCGVTAGFDDGSSARGSFLVGADGIHSRVRQLIDPAAACPCYAGFGNVGGFSPLVIGDDRPGTYRMFSGPDCFFGYVTSPGGETWWFANPRRSAELTRTEARTMGSGYWKDRLTRCYRLDWSPAADVIRATTSELTASNQYDLPRVDRWHGESMIIIGDAAHAPASSSGQGASMAIEDGVVLAKCLRDQPSVPAAFAAYEQLRRRRTEAVVRLGRLANKAKPGTGSGPPLTDAELADLVERSGRADFWRSLAWLHEYRVAWEEPERVTSSEFRRGI